MNLDKFDLDVTHYDCDDIEQLFGLSYPYTTEGIAQKKRELNSQILANNTLGAARTEEIVDFLDAVAARLTHKVADGGCETGRQGEFVGQANGGGPDGTLIATTQPQNAIAVNTYLGSGRVTDQPVAPPGQINPINTHTITKLVNIDTQFRDDYYTTISSDIHITLPFKLDNVIQMTLQEAIMPVSWYAISESRGNNKFVLNVAEPQATKYVPGQYPGPPVVVASWLSANVVFGSYVVTVPDGNYSPPFGGEEGLEKLEDAVNDAICRALDVPEFYPRIAYAIDRKTGKSYFYEKTIDASANLVWEPWYAAHGSSTSIGDETLYPIKRLLGVEFNVNSSDPTSQADYMAPLQLQLGWQLGFRNAEYRGVVNIDTVNDGVLTPAPASAGGLSLVEHAPYPQGDWVKHAKNNPNVFISEGIALVKGPAYGYIVIDDYNNNVNQNFTQAYAQSVFRNSSVMSKISLSQLQSSAAYLQSSVLGVVTTRTYFGPVDIQKLHIQFLDEYGRVINLNNMDWSLTLSFICQYDK